MAPRINRAILNRGKTASTAAARTELECRPCQFTKASTFGFIEAHDTGTMPDLYVYGLSGRLVAKPKANDRKPHASYIWDARRHGQGIYLARLPYRETMRRELLFLIT